MGEQVNVSLEELERQARESACADVPGMYFAVLVGGQDLLELVALARGNELLRGALEVVCRERDQIRERAALLPTLRTLQTMLDDVQERLEKMEAHA